MMTAAPTISLEEFLAGHGGSRPGSGRKAEYGARQRPVTMFLSEEHYAFLENYPSENISDSVRLLCEKHARTRIKPQRVRMAKGVGQVHTSITVPEEFKDFLTQLGQGQFVSGVRLLIEIEMDRKRRLTTG